jgi:hypothetical protein
MYDMSTAFRTPECEGVHVNGPHATRGRLLLLSSLPSAAATGGRFKLNEDSSIDCTSELPDSCSPGSFMPLSDCSVLTTALLVTGNWLDDMGCKPVLAMSHSALNNPPAICEYITPSATGIDELLLFSLLSRFTRSSVLKFVGMLTILLSSSKVDRFLLPRKAKRTDSELGS